MYKCVMNFVKTFLVVSELIKYVSCSYSMIWIIWQELFCHSKYNLLHSLASKCYFRNFCSSPAEQREKVKVTRGKKEGGEPHSAGWRSWRSCRLTDMRGKGWKPSRYIFYPWSGSPRLVNTTDILIMGFLDPSSPSLLRHGLQMLRWRLGRWPRQAFGTQGKRKRFTF